MTRLALRMASGRRATMIWVTAVEMSANEKYANDIACGIGNSIGADIVDNLSYGYGGSTPTFSPPAPLPPLGPPPSSPRSGGGGGGGTIPRPPQQEL